MADVNYVTKDGDLVTAIMDDGLVARGCFTCAICSGLLTMYEE
jgi:hypothetical protein